MPPHLTQHRAAPWTRSQSHSTEGSRRVLPKALCQAAKHQPSVWTTALGTPTSLPMRPIKHNLVCTEVQPGEQSQGKLGAGEEGWLQGSPSCLDPKPFGMSFWEFNIISASSKTPFPQGFCWSLLGNT